MSAGPLLVFGPRSATYDFGPGHPLTPRRFGPGIDLLRSNNKNRKLVESLIAQGVRFDVCINTVDTIERETGKRPAIISGATPVQVGVGQIMFLTENGYTLVRP